MREFLLLLIFVNLLAWDGYAQKESGKDSLLRLLKVAKQDTNKVKLLLAISVEVEDNEPVTSEMYCKSAALLSKQLSYQEGEYNSLNSLAKSYYIRGLYDTSFIFFTDALYLAEKMKDIVKIGSSKLNIGSIYREKGEFEKALAYCMEGRRIIENTNNDALKAKLDDALLVLYFERAEYDKAIEYGESALKVARKSADKMFLVKCAVNLSLNYMSKKRYSDAEPLLRESLVIAKAKNNKRVESAVLVNLGGIALKRKDAINLKNYAARSLQLSREIGSLDGEALALRAMGMGHLLEENIDSAKYYAGKAFTMDTLHHFRKEIIEILNLLANISFASGNIKEGFDYDERVSDTLELMVNEIISQQSADLEKKYETEKKDSQLKIQQAEIHQKNIYNYFLIGGAVAILLILLLTFRTFQQKQ